MLRVSESQRAALPSKSYLTGNVFMAKFLFVYRGSIEPPNMSPEEMQQHMQKWHTWISEGMQKGWITNPGDALKMEGKVVNSKKMVLDGPFVEAKEIVGGYSVVTAESLQAAAELAKGCPGLLMGGSVEVRTLEGLSV
jgi:hypothetical protein